MDSDYAVIPLVSFLSCACFPFQEQQFKTNCISPKVSGHELGISKRLLGHQAVHILEDAGDTELPALAGGDVLRTIKIIGKEVRQSSKVARAGMERLSTALTLVMLLACSKSQPYLCSN